MLHLEKEDVPKTKLNKDTDENWMHYTISLSLAMACSDIIVVRYWFEYVLSSNSIDKLSTDEKHQI